MGPRIAPCVFLVARRGNLFTFFLTSRVLFIGGSYKKMKDHFKRAKKRYNGWAAYLEAQKTMGNASYETFNALPLTAKAYWAYVAKQKNAEIRAEIEDVQEKLQAFSKVGPLAT